MCVRVIWPVRPRERGRLVLIRAVQLEPTVVLQPDARAVPAVRRARAPSVREEAAGGGSELGCGSAEEGGGGGRGDAVVGEMLVRARTGECVRARVYALCVCAVCRV